MQIIFESLIVEAISKSLVKKKLFYKDAMRVILISIFPFLVLFSPVGKYLAN